VNCETGWVAAVPLGRFSRAPQPASEGAGDWEGAMRYSWRSSRSPRGCCG